MELKKILQELDGVKKVEGKTSLQIKGIASNSKEVKEGYLFVAVRGGRFDGADFIDEAIDRGVSSVILELDKARQHTLKRGVTFIYVDDSRIALSIVSRAFYGDVSNKMHLVGITGTNGKTTTAYLIESLLKTRNKEIGVIGTINYRFGGRLIPALNTTPGALNLYSLLSEMYKNRVRDCILEVSSHSLEQGRVDTLNFDVAVFTNLTSEHLDYHKEMQNYLASKQRLFTKIKKGGYAIINKDDPYAAHFIEKVRSAGKAGIVTYGIEKASDVYAEDIDFSFEGLRFRLCVAKERISIDIESQLIGRHNVYNILAAASYGIAMAMGLEEIVKGITSLNVLPGRFEKIDCGQDFSVFVDYAHTENGIENALRALRELRPKRLMTVFGCGGDRDRSKRANMGRVSSELSDKVFITSDNPRTEEPMDIINEIVKGISDGKDYVVELDRFRAIAEALNEAKKGDIVLVAGKGHERYQIFKDVTVPFDDREVVKRILNDKIPNTKHPRTTRVRGRQIPNKSQLPKFQ